MKRTLTTLLACAVMVAPAMAAYTYSNHTNNVSVTAYYSDYESVTFESNTNTSRYGGAIYIRTGSAVSFTNNGDITFGSNAVSGTTFGYGGAIYGKSGVEFNSNTGAIAFTDNKATSTSKTAACAARGGAIYSEAATTFSSNSQSIGFSGNEASSASVNAQGGAIYSLGDTTFSDSGNITFSNNTASSTSANAQGGAICSAGSGGVTTFSGNSQGLSFNGNKASSTSANAQGGAIYSGDDTTFSDNGNITFSNNTAGSTSANAQGGAIDMAYYAAGLNFTNNKVIEFSGNTATGSSSDGMMGGAIYTTSVLSFTGNEDIKFIGNKVSNSSSSAFGGAIYIGYDNGSSCLEIDGSALFQKNTEISNGTYRLRSIYQGQGSSAPLSLSASTGKSIEFRDSIYSNAYEVTLNSGGDGTIRFTGATTEADLKEMKGSDGTDTEIADSRTSELTGDVTLYNGKLVVEEKAVLNIGGTLTTNTGSSTEVSTGAQLNLIKANTTMSSLTLGGGTVTLGTEDDHAAALTTTSLTVTADSALNADLVMDEGTLTFSEGAVLTMGCSVTIGDGVTIVLADEVVSAMKGGSITSYDLMDSVEEATVGNVTVTSANSGDLGSEWSVQKSGDKLSVVKATPEPATATLSLLALAGLAARRRRR